jgi:RND family efflux transporter MFP subunit
MSAALALPPSTRAASQEARLTRLPRVSRFAVLAVWLSGSIAAATAAEPAAAPVVPVARVLSQAPALSQRHEAVLQPVRQAVITAQSGGRVLALSVQAGDAVRRGQVLLRLDDREAAAGERASVAGVAQAQAQLQQAEATLARQKSLAASGFLSPAAVEQAETGRAAAQAALRQAEASQSQAGVARGFAAITAPFDGIVLSTAVDVGDLALPGRPLLTVYEPGRLRAVVALAASDRPAATIPAASTRVRLPDGRLLIPGSSELLPGADPVSQTFEWRLALPAGTPGVHPGQAVEVTVAPSAPAAAASAPAGTAALRAWPTVPVSAVLRRGELTAVYVAAGDRFVLRPVRLGAATGERVPVLAGLAAGEVVALEPVRAGLAGARPAAARAP